LQHTYPPSEVQALKVKISFNTLSMVLAAIVLLEGMAIAANARQFNSIQSLGTGLNQGTVALIGAQLLVLGLVALLAFLLPKYVLKGKEKLNKLLSWVPYLAGAIVLVEGLVAVSYASHIDIAGIGGMRSFVLAAFGAQLFVLGVGLVLFRMFAGRESLKLLFRLAMFVALAAVGLFVVGIADHSFISGIGDIDKGLVQLAGAQLFALAMAGIGLMWLEGRSFMQRKVRGHRLGALSVIGIAVLICLEGMILASIAAPFSIDGIGGMLARTMTIGGLLLALLALLIPISYYFFEKGDYDVRKVSSTACLFLVFLLPFALLI
jgi:hypothetical protein